MGRITELSINAKNTRDKISIGFRNTVKCSKGKAETTMHRNAKWILASFCWENNLNFHTEATFRNGSGRADFIIEEWGVVFEILETEELKTFLKKHYPLPTIPLQSTITLPEARELLLDLWGTNGKEAGFYRKIYIDKLS